MSAYSNVKSKSHNAIWLQKDVNVTFVVDIWENSLTSVVIAWDSGSPSETEDCYAKIVEYKQ